MFENSGGQEGGGLCILDEIARGSTTLDFINKFNENIPGGGGVSYPLTPLCIYGYFVFCPTQVLTAISDWVEIFDGPKRHISLYLTCKKFSTQFIFDLNLMSNVQTHIWCQIIS